MEIVVDTNILISSLLKDGLTRRILFLAPFDMYTISYARSEIEANQAELLRKSKLDDSSFAYIMDIIFSKIKLASSDIIEPYRHRSMDVMREIDIDDSPFLALAMALECPIWSNDSHFKKQNIIKAFTTADIISLLKT